MIKYDDYTVCVQVAVSPKKLPKVTAVLPVAMLHPQPLPFPDAYIVVRGLAVSTAYELSVMPALAFDAWIKQQSDDAALIAAILGIDRSRWSLEEKWLLVNELLMRGVDLPLCDRDQAEQIWAMEACCE